MTILIHILKIIRKLFKSLGKKEKKIIRILNYLIWKKRNDNYDLIYRHHLLEKEKTFFIDQNLWPKKIAACVAFSFKEERLNFLSKICKNLEIINPKTDLTIIVNDVGFEKKDLIKKKINEDCSLNVKFFNPKDLLDPRLLPFAHYEVVKEKIKDKEFSHFLYLEDDILISEKNIKYWMASRESLKKYQLIPGFLRTEINLANKEKYLVDSTKKNIFFLAPKVFNKEKDFAFVNLQSFYSGTYFYDRELMLEHLSGPSKSLDFGHGSYNQKFIITEMQELGLLERASAGLAYKDVPLGYFHRNVVPVDVKTKQIKNYCLIEHLSNKFANTKSDFGKIKVNDLFY
jgi:hypothetical protein